MNAGTYGSPESPITLVVNQQGLITRAVQLPTLGGTAVEPVASMPPVPPAAWLIFGLGLGALVMAARRGREKSPAPRAPAGGFRSQPYDDVMLAGREG